MYSCTAGVMEVVADIVACVAIGCVGIILVLGTAALVKFFYKGMK